MDDPALDPAEHDRALRVLERINRVSGAAGPIARAIAARVADRNELSLLDAATGSGDVACEVARRLMRRGLRVRLILCDLSPRALGHATRRADALGIDAEPLCADILADGFPLGDRSVDAAMCSLFVHHLPDRNLPGFLAELDRVSRGVVVISDLSRGRAGLWAASVAGAVSGSRVVRFDAPQSVRAALTRPEIGRLARDAGIHGFRVRACFPFRWLATWTPGGGAP